MNKRDALRLKKGDWVAFGVSARSAEAQNVGWRRGHVLHVARAGGVKVLTAGGEEWIPHHHIHQGIDGSDPHFGESGTTLKG